MSNPNQEALIEKIDRYLQGEMPEKERKDFEEQIQKDPALKQEVDESRAFLLAMESDDEERQALKATNQVLQSVRDKTPVNFETSEREAVDQKTFTATKWKKITQWSAFAALFIVLAGVCYWSIFTDQNHEKLFNQYYETPANTLAIETRGDLESANKKGQLATIMELYENEHYKKALEKSTNYFEGQNSPAELRFYQSIIYLELNQSEKAIEGLKKLKGYSAVNKDRILWYLALAYMAEEKSGKAQSTLETLLDRPPSRYHDKAGALKNEIS